jgi:hypothetical protein
MAVPPVGSRITRAGAIYEMGSNGQYILVGGAENLGGGASDGRWGVNPPGATSPPKPGDTGTPGAPAPAPAPAPGTPGTPGAGLLAHLEIAFPWISQIGLSAGWFQELFARAASEAEIVTQLRQTPQYKQRFPGLFAPNGQIRMTEAQYIQQEQSYRQLLRQYGVNVEDYQTPVSLVGFFQGEVDPNELQDRLEVYKGLQEGSQAQRDAFYVYAGMDVSVDDLYEATVDEAAGQNLRNEYNARVAAGQFDYQTFITRATEVGLANVARELTDMSARGLVSGAVVQRVLQVDPNFARQIMDSIYTGGSGDVNQSQGLALQELISSFEYAALGAAATQAGLALPDRARIAEIRASGVERARAASAYLEFGRQQGTFSAAVQRLRGSAFTQRDFEGAAFLNDARQADALARGLASEEAAGRSGGSFRFDQSRSGGLMQRGLKI